MTAALIGLWTDLGLVLLCLVIAVAWWRARGGPASPMALVLLAAPTLLAALALSESLKGILRVERPCASGVATALAQCPALGDWSLPSNHATLAGALWVLTLRLWPRLGPVLGVIAISVTASRVALGVHTLTDVVIGTPLGAGAATLVVSLLGSVVTDRVEQWRSTAPGRVLVGPGERERGPATS